MSCRTHKGGAIAYIPYVVCYPAQDVEGNALGNLTGAIVEILLPGECDYKEVARVEFPRNFVRIPVFHDGAIGLRHRAVATGVTTGASAKCHYEIIGEPSEPIKYVVDVSKPNAPPQGRTLEVCEPLP